MKKQKIEGLLSNNEVKTQSNDGLLSNFTSQPAKEGGYTYSKPVSSDSLLSEIKLILNQLQLQINKQKQKLRFKK